MITKGGLKGVSNEGLEKWGNREKCREGRVYKIAFFYNNHNYISILLIGRSLLRITAFIKKNIC